MWWFIFLVICVVLLIHHSWQLKIKRLDIIKRHIFDASIQRRVADKYPHLTHMQVQEVLEGLRDYFSLIAMANGQGTVSMPSQAVDEAWHAFILSTKAYASFCQRAFGKFLHHHPAETMTSPTQATIGIKMAWNLTCRYEGINAAKPERLPRLFELDSRLNIANGFVYSLNCLVAGAAAQSYCASNIGSGCGSSSGCSGDSGGDGGGCGGD